jgi:PAS domain S-box-containing protein
MPTAIARTVASLLIALCLCATADAEPLDAWRREVIETRQLADNDAQAAYREAQRLEAVLPAGATPADRAKILNVLSRIEIYLALTDAAARHAEQALALAKQNDDKVGQVEADMNIALNSVNQGRIDALVAATTDSMTLIEDIKNPELVTEAILRTATMYGRTGAFDASMTLPMQAMDIAERSRDPMALVYAHQGMALALDQTGSLAEVLEHYEKMREAARAAHSKIYEADAILGIGNALTAQGKLREGEAQIREALAFYRAFGGPFYVAHAVWCLADNLKRQGQSAKALALLDEIIAIYQKHANKIGLWWTFWGRSGDYLAAGRLADAARDAQRANDLARAIGAAYYESQSTRRLAEIAAANGEYQAAYKLSAESARMKEKADRERAYTRMLDLAQRYRTEAKQQEIDELTRAAEQQTIRTRWLWTVLGGSIAILVGTALFFVRLRHSHALLAAANRQLQMAQEKIQAINAGLEQRVLERTAELRQQARYLRTLIDMLPMWTWFKDTSSRYLVANQAQADAYGSTPEAMAGKTDLDLAPRELALSHHADDSEVMASRQRKSLDELLPDGSGSRWMETYKAAVVDEDGTVLGTVGYARDISERKAAEAARNEALAEARRLAQVRSDFLAHMSHELRTPLNGILGYVQLLRLDRKLDEKQMTALSVIQQSGEQLLTLINDILDFAKIEAGRIEVNPVDIMLQRFLRTFTDVIGVRAEQKGLLFLCEAAPDLPRAIQADERLLRQLLLNLLSNAVKFTDHGKVTLRVSFQAPARLRFAVEDTGIGIAADQLEKIFQPFEQLGETRRQFGGTGLGLAISREFAHRLGAEIHVDSRVGAGSIFWFELEAPPVAVETQPAPAEGVVTGYLGPRKRILVVDDLADARTLLVNMLEPLGFELAQAGNGREAVELAQTLKPDLILMDVVMPEMDGYQAIAQLRQTAGFEQLPIIVVSASASHIDRATSLAKGASAFLPKPIEREDLLRAMASLLQIEWQRDDGSVEPPEPALPIVAPAAEDIERLHHLARQGNMRDIIDQAARLAARDPRHRGFAERLRHLALGYQSKAILQFVDQYRQGKASSNG